MYENEERITETEVADGLRALLYGEPSRTRCWTAAAQKPTATAVT